ncbi:hypothetical protein MLD38_022119 [Melastoma candidum]|uniref:Uncharacterized protein n=1 Tax=Melastoma candidum TaxID=119954 RepID=A0ACB9QLM9_9MYRT|nr:hypothetical protein MLD38_022119 [Melastoma candidum]
MGRSFLAHLLPSLLFLAAAFTPAYALQKSYIVYLGRHSHDGELTLRAEESIRKSHYSLLGSVLGSNERARESIFYSYTKDINGFAAVMDEAEAAEIANKPDVLSVIPNIAYKLHTTRSWQFLGLEKNGVVSPGSVWEKARFGEGAIIGNLDTGVWPESRSFNDEGFGPIPSRWKGICQKGVNDGMFCNRKLIGVRYYVKGYLAAGGRLPNATVSTARDRDGHGTHTLSTAGGSFAPNANLFGRGNGTAKGGSPRSRVAAYKVCGDNGCFSTDILAAFDDAIADGVGAISVSLGSDFPLDFIYDSTAIGAFHAVMRGVVVVVSAGNSGPYAGTVSNLAPWMFTVAASTMDREFTSYVALGNKVRLKGASISEKGLPRGDFYHLISAADANAANATAKDALLCLAGTLDPSKARDKILVCLRGINARVEKGEQALLAGAAGMILANDKADGNDIIADPHVLPAAHLTYKDGQIVFAYVNSTRLPTAFLTRATTYLDTKPAPFIASFSSRGPNPLDPAILKPDITAPGVNVLAAYSEATSPTDQPFDLRRVPFNVLSGTSMSCPHVSGIVGLLKTAYPEWSPAAIRSAIMTTAVTQDNERESILDSNFIKATPFDYGAGHVHPTQILDPGLIYDLGPYDYVNYLCGRGYSSTLVRVFTNESYTCPPKFSISNFNYPSITIPNLHTKMVITRRVTNVGPPGKYTAQVKAPAGVSVSVRPVEMVFKKTGEEKEFKVVFKPGRLKKGVYAFGGLNWSDGKHNVRSPLVVKRR